MGQSELRKAEIDFLQEATELAENDSAVSACSCKTGFPLGSFVAITFSCSYATSSLWACVEFPCVHAPKFRIDPRGGGSNFRLLFGRQTIPAGMESEIGSRFMSIIPTNLLWGTIIEYGSGGNAGKPAHRQERAASRLADGSAVAAWRGQRGRGYLAECNSAIRQIENLRYGSRPLMAADARARFFTPEGRTMNVGARE
jgi:hypothetical protein